MKAFTINLALVLLLASGTFAKSPLKELAENPDCQIVFDERVGEYQLKWRSKTDDGYVVKAYPIKFDPFTGEPLESRRDELFTKPSREEMKRIDAKLSKCHTIKDVIRAFGEPDRVWPADGNREVSQYDFHSKFDTIQLTVQVDDDGKMKTMFSGKQIKRSVNEK